MSDSTVASNAAG